MITQQIIIDNVNNIVYLIFINDDWYFVPSYQINFLEY